MACMFDVGEWRLDTAANELRRGAQVIRLEPKVAEVLACLAGRAGEVVSREELLAAVWPDVIVGDDALTQAIIKLRKALGDDARRPRYIGTHSKRGYRLIAPVSLPTAAEFEAASQQTGAGLSQDPLSPSGGGGNFEDVSLGRAVDRSVPEPAPSEAGAPAPASTARPARRRARRAGLGLAGVALAALFLFLASLDGSRRFGLPWPDGFGEVDPATQSALPVIAVLPLANHSGDPAREYFSDGVTEDIIQALGRYSELRVISRTSVEQYKRRPPDAQLLKRELGARYLVKGNVREAEGKLRVGVELADADSGLVMWSERYTGEGRDVFDIQDRIVQSIVGSLAVKVTALERQRAAASPPRSLEAYDLVLRARALVVKSERAANAEARRLLAQALERAPDYADAHVVLSEAEYQRANFGWVEDPDESLSRAERSARRALTLEGPGAHARAHGQLGLIYAMRNRFDEALEEADQAIAVNPSDAFAFDARGGILIWLGRLKESITATETALRLDPAGRSAGSGFNLVLARYCLGQYPAALASADTALSRYPDAAALHALRAATLAELGRPDEARHAADALRRIAPFFPAQEFGNRFVDPQLTARVQRGLRKAGL